MFTIDITPTWESAVMIYMSVLSNADASFEARRGAEEELLRLARMVDAIAAERSAESQDA